MWVQGIGSKVQGLQLPRSSTTGLGCLKNIYGHKRSGICSRSEGSQMATRAVLEELKWDNKFIEECPADPEQQNSLRQVHNALFSFVHPTPPASEPYLIDFSTQMAEELGLDPSECERPEFALVMSGAAPMPGSKPYAQCYGGHQFGMWAGQLGDGRAISLGEVVGKNGQRWELQLKGAGKTPYSRRADGRAVLRSSIREYVASEAMAALGVPTTRALSIVGTGEKVLRDMFYTGNARFEPGAVVCRVAPSFVRFGTFQLPAQRGEGQEALVKVVADYVLRNHMPHLLQPPEGSGSDVSASNGPWNPYTALLREVCCSTGRLVAAWQSVGFTHGVLNTDNMSIHGLTIDYGPFGFMDRFDPYMTPNLTDLEGGKRYAFRNQPEIGQVNLVMLANALLSGELMSKEEAEQQLLLYSQVLVEDYTDRMRAKLGLRTYDAKLSTELMVLMYEDDADFTNTFRALGSIPAAGSSDAAQAPQKLPQRLAEAIGAPELTEEREAAWLQWLGAYQARLREEGVPDEVRMAKQNAANPKYIPRQHLLQYAIDDAENGDFSELARLMEVVTRPYDELPSADPKYSKPPPPEMLRRPGVQMLSCSS
ncbi:hypothetical protein DUNSADRAFT_12812 [Dunaliella salina]|uniref:Selenoprotein O n=1 Tax=Dunaliella salina TaxID=3046 RepID=A0ABQ7GAI7_DUNSA|nr:hypothetical protein DUNSADRAFT_12812 [Dunaliella salina]|eukprot:KAF5831621.1 hypothetical protein DUNSADRAFT_12812 [Dunaliella salina]